MTAQPGLQDIDQKKQSEISSPALSKLLWEAPTATIESIDYHPVEYCFWQERRHLLQLRKLKPFYFTFQRGFDASF